MMLPRDWSGGGPVDVDVDGTTVQVGGITAGEYTDALDEAVRRGATGPREFARFLEEEHGADAEVVGDASG